MSVAQYKVCLDLSDRRGAPTPLIFRQYDCNGTISFLITDNGRGVDLTGLRVRFMVETPDDRLYWKDLGPSMTMTVPTAITSVPGILHPYLQIRYDNAQLRTTGKFDILIRPSYDLSTEEQDAYKSALDELLNEFDKLRDEQKAQWADALMQVNELCDELKRRADSGEFNGPPGPPGRAATVAVGAVTDGPVSVVNSGTDTDAVLDFTLPNVKALDEGDIDSVFIEGKGY